MASSGPSAFWACICRISPRGLERRPARRNIDVLETIRGRAPLLRRRWQHMEHASAAGAAPSSMRFPRNALPARSSRSSRSPVSRETTHRYYELRPYPRDAMKWASQADARSPSRKQRVPIRIAPLEALRPGLMFENLSKRLSDTINKLRGRGRLSEENIREALREVRIALLEADVALPVVQALIERVKARAIGQEVLQSLSPGQTLIKIVNDELVAVMGARNEDLNLNCPAPAVILMAGLQGSGKTTTTGKLARLLRERKKKRVMVVSCDVYRPAAIEQLKTVAGQVEATFFESTPEQRPLDIARAALEAAKRSLADVLIVDTAGRLAIDQAMMTEVAELHRALQPIETLFVVDSMTGQDAANTAKAFAEALPLTGVILTKTDGDARGGAALSVRYLTGRPIKFMGAGEKLDALEPFHPDRVASRILGMGDVMSLIEDVTRKADQDTMEKLAKKVVSGKKFDLSDMRDQLQQMQGMGGMAQLMDKMPMLPKIDDPSAVGAMGDKEVRKMIAIINSMTKKERRFPDLLNGSRRARIAKGSGTHPSDVNKLMKQYMTMEKMMKKLSGGGMRGMLRALKGLGGGGGFGGMPGFRG